MTRPLTTELIRAKTRSDNLFYIKKFTLCGNEIDDVRILRQMPNMEVLSLSVNKIDSLREFSNCPKLQELYLRNNNIKDISEIQYLADLDDLRVLWLCENPCANHPDYRDIIISMLPNLENLDKVPVTQEERMAAARVEFDVTEPPKQVSKENNSPPPKSNNYMGGHEDNTPKHNERRGAPSSNVEITPPRYQERDRYQPSREDVRSREGYRVRFFRSIVLTMW